ncbi:MAG: cytochrome c oxidase subunit 3 [Alphaproteobacteria bacterium]|nr:cytochrome c oxidase subunit 3 [Alphaproteobacteria bacterium]
MSAADTHQQKHPYHLVDPSPWPIVGSFAALLLFGGAVMWMHEVAGGGWITLAGLVGVAITMVGWWRDVVREATFQGHHTPVVQLGHRYGMALFIASEVMFFVAFFWAFFNASLFPFADGIPGAGIWPPEGVTVFNPWSLPFLNTLILLTSGVTVTWAHHALQHGDRRGTLQGLALTILLGLAFTGVQGYEYLHAPFGFSDGIYPSTFFMATGFHGFHVIIGTTFLIVCFFRAWRGHFKPDHHFGFEAAAWYWHFVDVVWLFLFCCIYWWGKGNAPLFG